MRVMPLGLMAAAVLVAACAGPADPWISADTHAADAAAGGETLLRNHFDLIVEGEPPASVTEEDTRTCSVEAYPIEILQQGQFGTARVAAASETIEAPDSPCDGVAAEGTGVFYEAASGVSGIDTVVYREFRDGAAPDTIHTMRIRVR